MIVDVHAQKRENDITRMWATQETTTSASEQLGIALRYYMTNYATEQLGIALRYYMTN